MQIIIIRSFVSLVYVSLFFISGWLTIELWLSSAMLSPWASVAVAVALHCSLYFFAAAARGLPLDAWVRNVTSVFVLVLFLVSVLATVGQLEAGFSGGIAKVSLAQTRLDEQNRIVALRLSNAETYSKFERATKSGKQLQALEDDKRDALLTAVNDAGAMTHLVGLLGGDAAIVRLVLFVFLAVLLDGCGIWAAFLLFVAVPRVQPVRTESTASTVTVLALKNDIDLGVFDDRPTVAKVRTHYGIGSSKATQLLEALAVDGVVVKGAKGWERVVADS